MRALRIGVWFTIFRGGVGNWIGGVRGTPRKNAKGRCVPRTNAAFAGHARRATRYLACLRPIRAVNPGAWFTRCLFCQAGNLHTCTAHSVGVAHRHDGVYGMAGTCIVAPVPRRAWCGPAVAAPVPAAGVTWLARPSLPTVATASVTWDGMRIMTGHRNGGRPIPAVPPPAWFTRRFYVRPATSHLHRARRRCRRSVAMANAAHVAGDVVAHHRRAVPGIRGTRIVAPCRRRRALYD